MNLNRNFYIHKSPINNKPVLVQIMAWRRSGDKPLSEPMMAQFTDAYKSLGLNELISPLPMQYISITHWSHDKMAYILQIQFFYVFN